MATVAAAAAVALHRFGSMPRSPAVLARGGAAPAGQKAVAGEGGGAPPPARMPQRAMLRIGIPSPPDRVTSLDRAAGSKYDPTYTERGSHDGDRGHRHDSDDGEISGSAAAGSAAGSRCSGGGGSGGSDRSRDGPYDDYMDDGDDGGDGDGGGNDGDRLADSSSKARGRSELYGTFGGRQWRRRTDVISEHQTVFKILVSYVQVVSLVNNTPVTWPSALVNSFNVASQASSATSSLASLDCSMSAAVGLPKSAQLFLIQVLSPAFWSAALVLFWLARAAWRVRRGRLQRGGPLQSYLHNRIIISVNCIIFVMYPSVVTQLFSLFSCMQLDAGPPQLVCPDPWRPDSCRWDRSSVGLFWTQDLEQRCYRGVHLTLCAAVGVPGLVLFAAGIPLLSAWWLWRNRAKLWDDGFIALYGSLYQEYEDEHYYWESVVMLRKLTVTAVIVFAGTYRWQLTLLLSMGVIATSLLLQVAYRPFETDAMDELERLGLVATLLTFYLATYFMDDSVSRGVRVGLSFAILVINAVTVFIMCVAIARELHRAALFRLLRISSARGDLPLSFVVQVGLLYGRWRGRVALTRLRTALYRISPRLFPLDFPPDADAVFVAVARSEAAAAANAVLAAAGAPTQAQPVNPNGERSATGGGKAGEASARPAIVASPMAQRDASSRSLLVRRRASSAAAQVLAAALRGAWEHHHHGAWLLRVFELSERVSAAEEQEQRKKLRRRRWSMWRGSGRGGSDEDDENTAADAGREGGMGGSGAGSAGWRQMPGKLMSRVRTAARRLPAQLHHTASRLTRRATHRVPDFTALGATSPAPAGGGATAGGGGGSMRRRQQSYRQYGADDQFCSTGAAAYSPIEITTPPAAFAADAVISAAAAAVAAPAGGSAALLHLASRRRSSRTRPAPGLAASANTAEMAAAGGGGTAGAAANGAVAAAVAVGPGGVRLTTNPVALEPDPELDAEHDLADSGSQDVRPEGSQREQRK
ncbi:hypothetical protein HXX76_012754 [Chlamydomonas incerta]|uniref:TRP C-terminal domain-containing protein n=1 Tax=Chlamydomonas incerta TaxID=51695 RepID=A0A835SH93_CHLIN|nr:hypothetical protein HXX76_012754 [Chlamydomonas incerta]|eukprot:KAG2426969.1 hypothetical protein HXX76_012754 [Chlamydomonas incerta]